MIRGLAVIVALTLAGCGKSGAPAITLVPMSIEPAPTPAECNPSKDPKWTDLPERRLNHGDWPILVRTSNANLDAFEVVESRRRACFEVLEARKSSSPAKE
jgi:hypothetical protein